MLSRYFLKTEPVKEALNRRHVTHAWFAHRLGISRPYWSQILNRHRPVSPKHRSWMLQSGVFAGMAETDLWDIEADDSPSVPACLRCRPVSPPRRPMIRVARPFWRSLASSSTTT